MASEQMSRSERFGEARREPAAEPRREPAAEPRREPCGEPRLEPCGEPRREPAAEPRREPCGEPRLEPCGEPRREPRGEQREVAFVVWSKTLSDMSFDMNGLLLSKLVMPLSLAAANPGLSGSGSFTVATCSLTEIGEGATATVTEIGGGGGTCMAGAKGLSPLGVDEEEEAHFGPGNSSLEERASDRRAEINADGDEAFSFGPGNPSHAGGGFTATVTEIGGGATGTVTEIGGGAK